MVGWVSPRGSLPTSVRLAVAPTHHAAQEDFFSLSPHFRSGCDPSGTDETFLSKLSGGVASVQPPANLYDPSGIKTGLCLFVFLFI